MDNESISTVQEVELSEDENSREAIAQTTVSNNASNPTVRRNSPVSKIKLPPINVREKIFLCLDVTPSCSGVTFRGDQETVESLIILKQSVLIFIHNKISWNPKTEVSIILLNGSSVSFYSEFTSDRDKLSDKIKRIHVPQGAGDMDMEDEEELNYDLDKLFETISESIELPEGIPSQVLPTFIIRCILFYGRSKVLRFNHSTEHFSPILSCPYFFFDCLFMHENSLDKNVKAEILRTLSRLDNGYSYILETDNNTVNFLNKFALLSSHPLQRPPQSKSRPDIQYFKKLLTS